MPWARPGKISETNCGTWRKAPSPPLSSRRTNFNKIPTECATMADQTFRSTDNSGSTGPSYGSAPRGFDRPAGTTSSGGASSTTAKGIGDQAKDQAKSVTDQAKGVTDQA